MEGPQDQAAAPPPDAAAAAPAAQEAAIDFLVRAGIKFEDPDAPPAEAAGRRGIVRAVVDRLGSMLRGTRHRQLKSPGGRKRRHSRGADEVAVPVSPNNRAAKVQRVGSRHQGTRGSLPEAAAIPAAAPGPMEAVSAADQQQQQQRQDLQPGTPASQAGSSPGKAAAAAADAGDGSQATAASLPTTQPSSLESAAAAQAAAAAAGAAAGAAGPVAAGAAEAAEAPQAEGAEEPRQEHAGGAGSHQEGGGVDDSYEAPASEGPEACSDAQEHAAGAGAEGDQGADASTAAAAAAERPSAEQEVEAPEETPGWQQVAGGVGAAIKWRQVLDSYVQGGEGAGGPLDVNQWLQDLPLVTNLEAQQYVLDELTVHPRVCQRRLPPLLSKLLRRALQSDLGGEEAHALSGIFAKCIARPFLLHDGELLEAAVDCATFLAGAFYPSELLSAMGVWDAAASALQLQALAPLINRIEWCERERGLKACSGMLNLLRAAGSSLASTPDLMPLATLRHAICADAACEATAADGLRAFLGILQGMAAQNGAVAELVASARAAIAGEGAEADAEWQGGGADVEPVGPPSSAAAAEAAAATLLHFHRGAEVAAADERGGLLAWEPATDPAVQEEEDDDSPLGVGTEGGDEAPEADAGLPSQSPSVLELLGAEAAEAMAKAGSGAPEAGATRLALRSVAAAASLPPAAEPGAANILAEPAPAVPAPTAAEAAEQRLDSPAAAQAAADAAEAGAAAGAAAPVAAGAAEPAEAPQAEGEEEVGQEHAGGADSHGHQEGGTVDDGYKAPGSAEMKEGEHLPPSLDLLADGGVQEAPKGDADMPDASPSVLELLGAEEAAEAHQHAQWADADQDGDELAQEVEEARDHQGGGVAEEVPGAADAVERNGDEEPAPEPGSLVQLLDFVQAVVLPATKQPNVDAVACKRGGHRFHNRVTKRSDMFQQMGLAPQAAFKYPKAFTS
ncbi:hypothetical protein CHLNCDRAFT_145594 [Chlorella variabilis]|uniref:Uncharacterized protein n=1 Tax=Chlorella variabilis TaxID=554065 RepID=E1ZDT7_CHLVA|nr:hypothetical protein CHLNCDRAFT_145594 [Chlorella variabilis]EFN56082.1 hypothetical protein CHLNCDRAFT_145594 [Chlorella variabilis]|eukprot:XP_005848184.1 hypothetical protein CHLNCDRAFT_145594 [Chlorella variabilis]